MPLRGHFTAPDPAPQKAISYSVSYSVTPSLVGRHWSGGSHCSENPRVGGSIPSLATKPSATYADASVL